MRNLHNTNRAAAACLMAALALSLTACHGHTRVHTVGGGIGSNGSNGSNGSDGDDGRPGPSGPTGPSGPQGEPGTALSLLDPLGRVTIGDDTLINGGPDGGPLGVSILSPDQAEGDVATVGVGSAGQLLTLGTGDGSTAQTSGGQTDGLLGLNLGGNQVLGEDGGNPLIDLGVLSPDAAEGTGVTGNVLSGDQPLGVGVGGPDVGQAGSGEGVGGILAPLGGLLSPLGGVLGGD